MAEAAAITYRDLRYIRLPAGPGLEAMSAFASEKLGLLPSQADSESRHFRSDARAYALSYWKDAADAAVALTVAHAENLDRAAGRLAPFGTVERIDEAGCARRQIKAGIAVRAPNGVIIELVWRPMTSGWRYHGTRDAGITGLGAVSLACTDIAANERFWVEGIGAEVADWIGDAVFLAIDDSHHRIALYPSARNGVLAVSWEVESINSVMPNWYFFQKRQIPVVHGPGRHPASNAIFLYGQGPDGVYYGFTAETAGRRAPGTARQFADETLSHCAWGSVSQVAEFKGGNADD